ncbi:ABC transporter ATP-binding protein [Desulfurococcaceae archaeon MEX13E-LK6-19]|nr:ABC transporter ATP-binding protein [Desulfurococcaceae archaeon MEX13E-LK6-19]
MSEKVFEPKPGPDTVLWVKDLKTYFPLRRGLTEIIFRRPRKYVRAVDGISFAVKEGEVFGLAGESGCGKTTTGRTILRLEEPTAGIIGYRPRKRLLEEWAKIGYKPKILNEYGDIDIAKVPQEALKPMRKELQMIFQDPYGSLNPRFTIYKILEEPLLIHGIGETKEERYDIVAKALEAVKLTPPEEFMFRYPHMISGGQRQRVVIARALILQPKFIVADEPVSMLDVSIRAEILELLMDLKRQFNLTYIFITHDLAVARYITDRIAIMYLGKIVEMGDTRKVIENPMHPYTKALVAAIPEPDPKNRLTERKVPIKGEVPSAIFIPPGCRFHPRCVVLDEHPELKQYCTRKEPPLVEVEPGHYAACWLYAKK